MSSARAFQCKHIYKMYRHVSNSLNVAQINCWVEHWGQSVHYCSIPSDGSFLLMSLEQQQLLSAVSQNSIFTAVKGHSKNESNLEKIHSLKKDLPFTFEY